MKHERLIAQLLCGECDGDKRVMAQLLETKQGIVLRASLTVSKFDYVAREARRERHHHDDVPLADMSSGTGRWEGSGPIAARVGCPDHGTIDLMADFLREIVQEVERDPRRKPIRRPLPHPPAG